MRSHPTPSFTTEPHSMTYLIHPPVSSFRVCCCCACSFMLIQSCTSPTNRAREREGKWERHKCFKELKKHYSFSNCFRHSKYSNICTSPSLFSVFLLSWTAARLFEEDLLRGSWATAGGKYRGKGRRPRRRQREKPLCTRSSQSSGFMVAPAEVGGAGAPVILWAHTVSISFPAGFLPPSLPSTSPI